MKTIKTVTSLLICAQLLSACSDKSFESTKAPNSVKQEMDGTGDGGGGNAINYKMLESYMIDPNELEVVKTRVSKILGQLSPQDEDSEEGTQKFDILKMKNWYLAPINLKVIPKEVLGIEFTENGHQQVALQTKDAIWIDSNLFSKMSADEQAKLIVHEVMMMSYLFKFVSLEDMCFYSERAGGSCGDQANRDRMKDELSKIEALKPLKARALNSRDYEIIRSMTTWIFANESQLSYETFTDQGIKLGFADLRFLSSHRNKEVDKIKLSAANLRIAILKSLRSGSLQSKCFLQNSEVSIDCEVVLEPRSNPDGSSVQPGDELWDLKIINKENQEILREETLVAERITGHITISGGFQIALFPYFEEDKNKIGTNYFSVSIDSLLNENNEIEKVNGISLQTLTVVHTEKEQGGNCRVHLSKSMKTDPQSLNLRIGVEQVYSIGSFEVNSNCP